MLLTLLLIARFVCTRISKTRGMLSKARSYVTKKLLFFFSFQSIHISHIATYYGVLHILQTLSMESTCCRKELFKQSVLQTTGPPVNPFFKNLGTSLFSKFISNWIIVKDYSTRYAKSYRPHTCRTNIKKFSILYQGPKF